MDVSHHLFIGKDFKSWMFHGSVDALVGLGHTVLIEVSPPPLLSGVWPEANHYPSLGLSFLACCVTQGWCKWSQVCADSALPKSFLLI